MPDTPTQLRIFVSHSHQNNDACRALVNALREVGADVWYDEYNMTSGRLGQTIERELRARPVFIVMLSPDALVSSWVEDETRWAYNLMRKNPTRTLLPIVCEAISEDDIWLFLQEFKRIEGPNGTPLPPKRRHQQTLRALFLTPPGETPVPMTPQPTESVSDLLAQGRALFAQQNYDQALLFFQRAAKADPSDADAWRTLGDTLDRLERPDEATAAYDRALAIDPDDSFTWTSKSWVLNMANRYSEGLLAAERALELNSEDETAWTAKGMALENLERHKQAIAAYRRSLAIDPDDATVWALLADPLEALDRNEEALAAYERTLDLDPAPAYNWRGKASILRALGRDAEAKAADRTAKKLEDQEKQ